MRRKGLIGWLVASFFIGVFAAIALIIFITQFKYHVTMAMVDYYFWNKEFDIPLALFSTDIKIENSEKYESSTVFLNKLYYADVPHKDKEEELKNKLKPILDKWSKNQYTLVVGDVACQKEECKCELQSSIKPGLIAYGVCSSECKHAGEMCVYYDMSGIVGRPGQVVGKPYMCWGFAKSIISSVYPLPVVFNGTHRLIPLSFTTEMQV